MFDTTRSSRTTSDSTLLVIYIGIYKSKILFQLDLRLKKIETEVTLRIQVIHVNGMHMIAQDKYVLSRGLMNQGIT